MLIVEVVTKFAFEEIFSVGKADGKRDGVSVGKNEGAVDDIFIDCDCVLRFEGT